MKTFLKDNVGFLSALLLALAGLCALWFVSCGKKEDLTTIREKIKDAERQLEQARRERAGYGWVGGNLELARKDGAALFESRAEELNGWKKILGGKNLADEVADKTSDDVNRAISAFLDDYRKKATEGGIAIKGADAGGVDDAVPGFFPPGGGLEGEDKEGFGFSGYEKSWPTISDEEARRLLMQKLIIEDLLDALIASHAKDDESAGPLEFRRLRRESVGEVDGGRIGGDALSADALREVFVKRRGKIDTHAFEVSFLGRTHALRAFLANLRRPFLIRDVKVDRAEVGDGDFSVAPSPFIDGPGGADGESGHLPIIKDVNSEFTVLVEYAVAVHLDFDLLERLSREEALVLRSLELDVETEEEEPDVDKRVKDFLKKQYPSTVLTEEHEQPLKEFLRLSGSAKKPADFIKK